VSQTTRDRLDARFSVNRRGTVRLKGVGAFETWLVRPEGGRRGMPTTTSPKESVRAGA
jgi:hypothetical protein